MLTVNTLFGHQMGGRKGYNPKNKGKKSYQPILTFLAETREYIAGELRNGDRPTGAQIARHLESVFAALPEGVEKMYARADSGFDCAEAVEAYAKCNDARKRQNVHCGGTRSTFKIPVNTGRRTVHSFGAEDLAFDR